MIKVIYGTKGMGKTKLLVDKANNAAAEGRGAVAYIDDNNQLMYDLKHEVRFVNMSDFPVRGAREFMGFLCGMISGNYDLDTIIIDGLTYIVKEDISSMEGFFKNLKDLVSKFKVDLYISINGEEAKMPEFVREFV